MWVLFSLDKCLNLFLPLWTPIGRQSLKILHGNNRWLKIFLKPHTKSDKVYCFTMIFREINPCGWIYQLWTLTIHLSIILFCISFPLIPCQSYFWMPILHVIFTESRDSGNVPHCPFLPWATNGSIRTWLYSDNF